MTSTEADVCACVLQGVTVVGVLATEGAVEGTVEVLDSVTKAEEASGDMTTTMMAGILEVRYGLSQDRNLTRGLGEWLNKRAQ